MMICPCCGSLLGHKELLYEIGIKKICDENGIDFNSVSLGKMDNDDKIKQAKKELVNMLCDSYCCKMLLLNYVDLVRLIK